MSTASPFFAFLRDSRLASHAVSALPVWLWSTDAVHILWANATGTAIFGSPNPAEISARQFDPHDQTAIQIVRLAASLPPNGARRLERLRGFGTEFGRALLCTCSRMVTVDDTPGILVVATEPAGPAFSLAERVNRLYAQCSEPVAVFALDGSLIFATAKAKKALGHATTLRELGADGITMEAIAAGRAYGDTTTDRILLERIGGKAATVLTATFLGARDPLSQAGASTSALAQADATRTPALIGNPSDAASLEAAAPLTACALEAPPHTAMPISTEIPNTTESPVPPPMIESPASECHHPLRFVWQMDAEGRFTLASDEFTEVIGQHAATALGRRWTELADELTLDPEGQVAQAVATHDTWSGITVSWPVDGSSERLKVELSGLPIFDRNRVFLGYRGFGVCRDTDRAQNFAQMRRSGFLVSETTSRAAPPRANEQPAGPENHEPEQASPVGTNSTTASGLHESLAEDRAPFVLIQGAINVVPFRSAASAETKARELSPVERNAFHELARQLTARLKAEETDDGGASTCNLPSPNAALEDSVATLHDKLGTREQTIEIASKEEFAEEASESSAIVKDRPLLDRIPVGILVYRFDQLLYANRAFLDWTGYDSLKALSDAGGLDSLFIESGGEDIGEAGGSERSLAITTNRGDKVPVEGRLFSIPWNGENALALVLASATIDDRRKPSETALRAAEAELRELKSILDIATEGVVIVDSDGRILAANRGAEVLFGCARNDLNGRFAEMFAPESRRTALDYLTGLSRSKIEGRLDEGREVTGRVRAGGDIPLFMTIGRVGDTIEKFCVVLRDLTPWKKAERNLLAAKQRADEASSAKSDFLARISHEIRTPLNSIIGFSEVMIGERFGPVGNDRYREYLNDIRASGAHLVSLLNDLLDLSKIESGKLELSFTSVNLNDLVRSCVASMQPQANRERILIRTSLASSLPPVVADARSIRQITLNLFSNAIRFTGAGGQVIVSTALSDDDEIVLRVRDTGIGMSEIELRAAIEPFRQLENSSHWGSSGTGLVLSLTKGLAEANRATFKISSKVSDGTLVEIAFPATRVLVD